MKCWKLGFLSLLVSERKRLRLLIVKFGLKSRCEYVSYVSSVSLSALSLKRQFRWVISLVVEERYDTIHEQRC